MHGRGAKGSVKDRLIHNRFLWLWKKRKKKKEERQERVRLQRLVEDQIRLKDVYPKEWERIPKKYVLVKKTLVSCKQVIQLPPYVPKLVEEVSFSRRKGIGPDRQTLSKQVQERKVLEKRINCLEKKQTILNEAVCMLGQQVEVVQTEKELALLFEMVKQIEDDLHTTVHGCKIVQQEYQHLFQKYPYLKTERFSNRFIAQQVDVIMNSQKKLEQINRRCVQQQANLQEQKKAITVKKKMAVDILQSTEKKEKKLVSSNMRLYQDKMALVQETEVQIQVALQKQQEYIYGIQEQVGKVEVEWQKKQIKMRGIHSFLAFFFHKMVFTLLTPFQPSRKKKMVVESTLLHHQIRGMRKLLQPNNSKIVYHYHDYSKQLQKQQDSFSKIDYLISDSLQEISLLIKEFQLEFDGVKDVLPEYEQVLKKLQVLENSLLAKKQEMVMVQQSLQVVNDKNKQKMKYFG